MSVELVMVMGNMGTGTGTDNGHHRHWQVAPTVGTIGTGHLALNGHSGHWHNQEPAAAFSLIG